jgi:hypothetical protein
MEFPSLLNKHSSPQQNSPAPVDPDPNRTPEFLLAGKFSTLLFACVPTACAALGAGARHGTHSQWHNLVWDMLRWAESAWDHETLRASGSMRIGTRSPVTSAHME